MASEDRSWGYFKTIANILKENGIEYAGEPSRKTTWKEFLNILFILSGTRM
jgi:hypothetical protein